MVIFNSMFLPSGLPYSEVICYPLYIICSLGFRSLNTFYETVLQNYQNLRKQSIIVVKRREEEPKRGKEHSPKCRVTKYMQMQRAWYCTQSYHSFKLRKCESAVFYKFSWAFIWSGEWKPFCRHQTQCEMNPPMLRRRYTTLCFVIIRCSWHTSYNVFKWWCRDKIIHFLLNFCTFLHKTIA